MAYIIYAIYMFICRRRETLPVSVRLYYFLCTAGPLLLSEALPLEQHLMSKWSFSPCEIIQICDPGLGIWIITPKSSIGHDQAAR